MNTETLTVQPKGEGFEIIVQHDQTGSAYGIDLSKDAHEQLRLHFVGGQLIDFQNFLILDGQLDLEPDEVKRNAEIFLGD